MSASRAHVPATSSAPAPFDLAGPLPTGTTVLEASAGTGKTYTIAGLVTRYVAEGRARVDQLLVVTFGRAATSELRNRVRERFVATRDALADPPAARRSADAAVRLLAEGTDGEVAARRSRLTEALASFDTATVATTHEFCLQVLQALGTAADLDPGTTLVESVDDLVVEVCDDLYLRAVRLWGASGIPFTRGLALRVARAAVHDGEALLVPTDAPPDSPAQLRVRFATQVRREVRRRCRERRVLGFDDLLTRVRDALTDGVTGDVARQRLRDRYAVVLVDEFQDTDPVQWEILRRAFHGHRTLVVIGDPKQAIYAFRGADVHAYLGAASDATSEATLDTSWRSDPALLRGLDTLLRRASLGDARIVVRPVRASRPTAALGPVEDPTPVRLKVLQRRGLPQSKAGVPLVDGVREAVVRDVAAEVVSVLRGGHTVAPREGSPRPLVARDVAVLVRTGAQAQLVRDGLAQVGVPCVLTGTSSVFATAAASDWLVLLEALEQPHRRGRVRRLALAALVGWSAAELDAGGDAASDELALTLRRWAEVLAERGVAGLFGTVAEETRLAERLLRRPDGERLLTDLRHVAESMHTEATAAQLRLTGLLSWLRARVEESGGDLDQERSRRLETDAAAVQVLTVHTCKGLEFPVVLVPFAWDAFGGGDEERLPAAHDAQGRRVLHVGGSAADDYDELCRRETTEDAGEELRLLYVAATRAVSRLVLWWAPSTKTVRGPLHRLLLAGDPAAVPDEVRLPEDDDALARMRELAASGAGLAVELVDREVATSRLDLAASGAGGDLRAATFERTLDDGWRRTSYTGLTRLVHDAPTVGSEAQEGVKDDEADEELPPGGGEQDDALRAVPSPMAELPGGTWFGTLVHAVLEDVAFPAPYDGAAVRAALLAAAEEHLRHRPGEVTPERLADALLPVVSTSLGPLVDGRRFRDVPAGDRLNELDFELPLAGGDSPTAEVRLGEVADLLGAHLAPGDPVLPYADALRQWRLGEQVLRGYLGGSIDVVLRVGTGAAARYVVVDHKTNRLAGWDVDLTAWHYRREALDEAMRRAHYPLQAMLYTVALHRFLRWRQPGYDPERHLGGVLYLFLRGMCGDAAGTGRSDVPGVWSWRPPASLVVALSDLLAGAGARS